eukprot:366483_1
MSKRSRKYFESFEEFGRLCDEAGICSPPLQKQKISADETVECTNHNNKAITPPLQIKNSILSASNSLSPSPSPPSVLSTNHKALINENTESKSHKLFDENVFYIASVGSKNKRTGVRKHWSDLTKNRVNVFNELISKNGGTLIETMDDFDTNNNDRLMVILSENIKRSDFDSLFGASTQQNHDIVFVTPAYITSSLKSQMKLSPKQFEPKCLKPQPESATNDKEEMDQDIPETKQNIDEAETHTRKPKTDWLDRNKHSFACQVANDGHKVNHNANITDILDEMQEIYACLGDKWREYGYKKANGFIKKYPHRITTENDVKQLMKKKGFSQKLAAKVLEIVSTGTLRKLNELKSMPQIKTIQLFSNIFGVGHVTAQKWYNLGLRTLDDLNNTQKFNIKLQPRQVMGLKYFHDLLIKIPRSEIREIEKFLKHELNELCPECIVNICGSYRRGKLKSGDIDVLVSSTKKPIDGLLNRIITRLYDVGFLVDDLSVPSGHNKHKEDHDSYMGICKLLHSEYKHYRHIDIKVYKPEHYAFAMLYFTGSDHFNRSMRYFAKKKGFTLSDTQLAPAIRMNNTKIFTFTQKAIKCETEQEIFAALALDYIKPTDRNTYENFGSSFAGTTNDKPQNEEAELINIEPYTP